MADNIVSSKNLARAIAKEKDGIVPSSLVQAVLLEINDCPAIKSILNHANHPLREQYIEQVLLNPPSVIVSWEAEAVFKKHYPKLTEKVDALVSKRLNEYKTQLGIGNKDKKASPSQKVYIIQCSVTGIFKVGISANPNKRLKSLQVGYPYGLALRETFKTHNARRTEKILHGKLQDFRLKGEWFHPSGISAVTRHTTNEYPVPERLNEALRVVYGEARQQLIGE